MSRRKKDSDNVVSLARKTNDSSKYTVRELLEDVVKIEEIDTYDRCITFVFNTTNEDGTRTYKFNYFTAGYKDRMELLGGLEMLKQTILAELFE